MRVSGSYVLLLYLADDRTIPVGRQGVLNFSAGCYAYVGSAMNGLYQRINRHLRKEKKRHWHIDYLLEEEPVVAGERLNVIRRYHREVSQNLEALARPATYIIWRVESTEEKYCARNCIPSDFTLSI